MSGFFGAVSKDDCVSDVFYGTDYHSHLGTKRGGMAVYCDKIGFQRAILLRFLSHMGHCRVSSRVFCALQQVLVCICAVVSDSLLLHGLSRQEYWSGLPFPSSGHESEK